MAGKGGPSIVPARFGGVGVWHVRVKFLGYLLAKLTYGRNRANENVFPKIGADGYYYDKGAGDAATAEYYR